MNYMLIGTIAVLGICFLIGYMNGFVNQVASLAAVAVGVIGMIIGIPVGMIIVNLYQAGLFDQLIKGIKIIVHDINEFRKY